MRDWHTEDEPPLKLIPISDALGREIKRDDLIKGLIPSRSLVSLFGETTAGKTFMALDLAMSVAMGKNWWDHPTKAGQVIYVAGEDAGGVVRRLQAYGKVHSDAARAALSLVEHPLDLTGGDYLDLVSAVVEAHGEGVTRLVVIDTADSCFGTSDDSTNVGMRSFIDAMKKLRLCLDCTVLAIMHPGHENTGRERGGSNLKAAMDVRLKVDSQADGAEQVLSCIKAKNDVEHPPMVFERRLVDLAFDEEGEAITSMVLHHKPDVPVEAAKTTKRPMTANARNTADALDAALDARGKRASDVFDLKIVEAERRLTPFTRVVDIESWREEAYRRVFSDKTGDTRKTAFLRARQRLCADHWVQELDGYAYRVDRSRSGTSTGTRNTP